MNKRFYPAIIVVEGATDEALLRSFLEADIVTTNGSEVSRETLQFLKKASEKREIVILTDPDSPGKRIRDLVSSFVPSAKHAFVRKEFSIKKGKVGVAESTQEEIIRALSNLVPTKESPKSDLVYYDLVKYNLVGPNSSKQRNLVETKYCLGKCNGKTLLKRLKALGIKEKELGEVFNGKK